MLITPKTAAQQQIKTQTAFKSNQGLSLNKNTPSGDQLCLSTARDAQNVSFGGLLPKYLFKTTHKQLQTAIETNDTDKILKLVTCGNIDTSNDSITYLGNTGDLAVAKSLLNMLLNRNDEQKYWSLNKDGLTKAIANILLKESVNVAEFVLNNIIDPEYNKPDRDKITNLTEGLMNLNGNLLNIAIKLMTATNDKNNMPIFVNLMQAALKTDIWGKIKNTDSYIYPFFNSDIQVILQQALNGIEANGEFNDLESMKNRAFSILNIGYSRIFDKMTHACKKMLEKAPSFEKACEISRQLLADEESFVFEKAAAISILANSSIPEEKEMAKELSDLMKKGSKINDVIDSRYSSKKFYVSGSILLTKDRTTEEYLGALWNFETSKFTKEQIQQEIAITQKFIEDYSPQAKSGSKEKFVLSEAIRINKQLIATNKITPGETNPASVDSLNNPIPDLTSLSNENQSPMSLSANQNYGFDPTGVLNAFMTMAIVYDLFSPNQTMDNALNPLNDLMDLNNQTGINSGLSDFSPGLSDTSSSSNNNF